MQSKSTTPQGCQCEGPVVANFKVQHTQARTRHYLFISLIILVLSLYFHSFCFLLFNDLFILFVGNVTDFNGDVGLLRTER